MTQTQERVSRLCYRAVEFRAESSSDGRTLEGYAAVYDQPTEIDSWEGTFTEVFKRGAFAKTLRERTPVLQFNHGRDMRTGSVPIGAFEELAEQKQGLFVRASLFDNDVVEPIRQAIEGGAIDGMSIRFRVVRETWTDKDGKRIQPSELANLLWSPGERGPLLRTIREAELFELGPVVFPAYQGTTVGVRSLLANLDDEDRRSLVAELAEELKLTRNTPDAGDDTTSGGQDEQDPDAALDEGTSGSPDADSANVTSGMTAAERDAVLRELLEIPQGAMR